MHTLPKLQFGTFHFRLQQPPKNTKNKTAIFDPIRKKFVALTPEEWVRQHCLRTLMEQHAYPANLLQVEKSIRINSLRRRYDILAYRPDGSVYLIVECKAPQFHIDQGTFDQIAQYNHVLHAQFLMVTNGLKHYYCQIDPSGGQYRFLPSLPDYTREN